jgi:hypothetical protein
MSKAKLALYYGAKAPQPTREQLLAALRVVRERIAPVGGDAVNESVILIDALLKAAK